MVEYARLQDVAADHRAPGIAHDEELPLSIMLEKVGNEFLPIRGHPVDGNRRRNGGGVVRSGGLAGAPLVPLDDGEIILPRALIQPVDWHQIGRASCRERVCQYV